MWGALASLGGSLLSAGLSAWNSSSVNNDNIEFQKEFAKNGVSWKIEDMKRAGLNPLLSTGINATTPSGGSSALADFSGLGASARDVGRMIAEKTAEKASADVRKASAEANNAVKTGHLIDEQRGNVAADTAAKIATSAQTVANLRADTDKKISEYLLNESNNARKTFENSKYFEAFERMPPEIQRYYILNRETMGSHVAGSLAGLKDFTDKNGKKIGEWLGERWYQFERWLEKHGSD